MHINQWPCYCKHPTLKLNNFAFECYFKIFGRTFPFSPFSFTTVLRGTKERNDYSSLLPPTTTLSQGEVTSEDASSRSPERPGQTCSPGGCLCPARRHMVSFLIPLECLKIIIHSWKRIRTDLDIILVPSTLDKDSFQQMSDMHMWGRGGGGARKSVHHLPTIESHIAQTIPLFSSNNSYLISFPTLFPNISGNAS